MEDYDDLDSYDGNPEHDMWVDFDYYENTGELADLFDENTTDEDADIFDE